MWRKILLLIIILILICPSEKSYKINLKNTIHKNTKNDTDIKIIKILDLDSNYHYYYINSIEDSSGLFVKKIKIKIN
jgi:hypothetical protein